MSEFLKFEATDLASRIDKAKSNLIEVYKKSGHQAVAEELAAKLAESSNEEKIKVAFVGQYDAGKSTIIAALTNNKDILIDSDIATDEVSNYSWGNVLLTDTPGLYTENPEHDNLTIDAIKQSDLLIYCITSDLFNPYTLKDFEKWAFESGYAGKMFLIINKMSKEAGEYEELKDNYAITLNSSLNPHSITEFPCSYVDAKDYKDGVAKDNVGLIEYSHFNQFIKALNTFVNQKGYLGRLDKPVMVMKESIDDITQRIADDDSNRAYTALVSRIEKKIDQERNQLSIESRNLVRRKLRDISDKGYELARQIGVANVDFSDHDMENLIEDTCRDLNKCLDTLCTEALDRLNAEVNEVLNSETATYFFKSINATYSEKGRFLEKRESKISRAQFDTVKNAVESITGKTIKLAVKDGAGAQGIWIKASEASGSKLHEAILAIGGTLGHNFKPWEAANLAKGVGNFAKVIGPILSILTLAMDAKEVIDENEKAKRIEKAQIEYRQSFNSIVSDLEIEYGKELSGMFDVYDKITLQLQDSRNSVQSLLECNDSMVNELAEIRKELVDIQTKIF